MALRPGVLASAALPQIAPSIAAPIAPLANMPMATAPAVPDLTQTTTLTPQALDTTDHSLGSRINAALTKPGMSGALLAGGTALLSGKSIGDAYQLGDASMDREKAKALAAQHYLAQQNYMGRQQTQVEKHAANVDKNAETETGVKQQVADQQGAYQTGVLSNARYPRAVSSW